MPPKPAFNDHLLWDAFREGDLSALDTIYQRLVRPLYNYGCKLTQDRELVEDCIQDTFVELWERRNHLGETDSIKFYLFKVLRRTIFHRLQQTNHHFRDTPWLKAPLEESVECKLVVKQLALERNAVLQNALEQLPARQKEVIFLRFYDELPFEDIARIMDIDIKSVYKLTYKALAALKKHITPLGIVLPALLLLFLVFFSV